MSYTALYRKFRPARFEDVKGQDHIVTTLENQIKSDRIGHAYLFCGTRGTGKTSVAKLFAKAINCENPDGINPCMECASCRAIQSGASMNVIETDAASNNGVDNIRQIIEEVQYPPTEGKKKVYIIDEVHMLSIGAFNALLKTLEEPPSYVLFILATTEVHKLPITIRSRCQRYDFKRIGVNDISGRIRELMAVEGLEAEDEAVRYVARAADGSMRDALSLLDQCVAFNFGKKLTYEMVLEVLGAVDNSVFSNMLRAIMAQSVTDAISLLEESIMEGRELTQYVTDFTWYLRNLLLAKVSGPGVELGDMSPESLKKLREEADYLEAEQIMYFVRVFSELTNQIRYANNKRVLIEIAIIKLCCPQMDKGADAIMPRILNIEEKLEKGVFVEGGETSRTSVPAPEVKPAELPKSVPEDVKAVVQNWRKILTELSPGERVFLREAKPSLGPDGELMLVFTNEMRKEHFSTNNEHTREHAEKNLADLKSLIGSVSGKDVEIVIELAKDEAHFISDYPDLSGFFQGMNVEVED